MVGLVAKLLDCEFAAFCPPAPEQQNNYAAKATAIPEQISSLMLITWEALQCEIFYEDDAVLLDFKFARNSKNRNDL